MNEDFEMYPMADPGGGPLFSLSDFTVLGRRLRARIFGRTLDIADNLKDRELPFTEYPACESCGSESSEEVLRAPDGNRIVECTNCGLWYSSPRVPEDSWKIWLMGEATDRNIQFTENRLRYGVALARNVPYSFSFWWRRMRMRKQREIQTLIQMHGGTGKLRLHDVGCGVGFLIKAAHDLGMQCSGNDLNGYAIGRMRGLFNLDVHLGTVSELLRAGTLKTDSHDLITMDDFIEHSYHPLGDLKTAFSMLRDGGIVSVRTFCVDSDPFRKMRGNWDMLLWNHTFHFSSKSLSRLVKQAGFEVVEVRVNDASGIVKIFGRKRCSPTDVLPHSPNMV